MKVEKNGYEILLYQEKDGLWISVYKGDDEIARYGATSLDDGKTTLDNCIAYMDKYGVDRFRSGITDSWWRIMTGIF